MNEQEGQALQYGGLDEMEEEIDWYEPSGKFLAAVRALDAA